MTDRVKLDKNTLNAYLRGVASFTFLAVIALMVNSGCQYKNVDQAFPINTKDTSNVSYSKYIQPLLQTNCYSCHSAANSGLGGGYVLDNYASLAVQANNGALVADITDPDINSVTHMPRGIQSLPASDIAKVKAWVTQGAQNN